MVNRHYTQSMTTTNISVGRPYHAYRLLIMAALVVLCSLIATSPVVAKSYSTSGAANANSNKLNVSVDRTQIYENDTIELKAIGQLELALDFSSLFNLRNMELPAPDIGSLADDFDIIDQQQKYNIQSVNGQNNATITWVYTLSPKRSGTLSIPSIQYKDQQSKAIDITVLKGNSNHQSGAAPRVFLEAELDKKTAYVQEQLTYTLRLYYADNLAGGDLSSPVLDNAIVEQLGDQKKYYRMHNNVRYEVVERNYLIFPQQSGELTIDKQTFNGTVIDSRIRKRKYIREHSPSVSINIKPPAANFSGKTWLPAMSLNLSERWDTPPENVSVGDSFTRTISIQALGLLGSALPPVTVPAVDGFKQYPDQPNTESMQHQAGVQSTRTESIAMVAISEGVAALPEIKIPWWDTVNNIERIAVIPSRQVIIGATQGSSTTQLAPKTSEPREETSNINNSINDQSEVKQTTTIAEGSILQSDNTWLYIIIVFLIVGWLVTTLILLKRRTNSENSINEPSYTPNEENAFRRLETSIQHKSPDILTELVRWGQFFWPGEAIISVAEIKQRVSNESFTKLLDSAENSFYAKDKSATWDNVALLKLVQHIRNTKNHSDGNKVLPDLYQQKE